MHIRVRWLNHPDVIVVVPSKLTKIEKLREILNKKFHVPPKLQRLFYGGKLLEDGYTFHDYNIKLNNVIQLMVQSQPEEICVEEKLESKTHEKLENHDINNENYKDAESDLYAIGDLIDMRDKEHGAWFEGKVVRIVHNPNPPSIPDTNCSMATGSHSNNLEPYQIFDHKNDLENMPPEVSNDKNSNPNIDIAKYFGTGARPKDKRQKTKKQPPIVKKKGDTDVNLMYKVQLDTEEEVSQLYCLEKDIRPRARTIIEPKDLTVGQEIMINHHLEYLNETGYWYDFKVGEIMKLRKYYVLMGTIYLGPDAVPQNDTKVTILDKIFAKEVAVPLAKRTKNDKMIVTTPERRSRPLNCLTCRDRHTAPCKECGCFICSRKNNPETIILCDECNKGFHMICLSPPLDEVPEGDWYCPICKRDPNDVIAPGASKQMKKAPSKGTRDWGRGMACVGKTKSCGMPANHFGPIPGIEVGMCWRFRMQLSEFGLHRPPVSGIHGRDAEGAYSIVLSGGYEDDVDNGIEFTYTGSGGRDLTGNKRTAGQSHDQVLARENKALAMNCAATEISDEGADAGDNWRSGNPVRVIRSYKMSKYFPQYAPKGGLRYDGIYKVVKYYHEKGLSGYRVWKYLLRRDDPSPAPWEPDGKEFPIVYPDGYLEAEAEKKALKMAQKDEKKGSKKRVLRDSSPDSTPPNSVDFEAITQNEPSAPIKKRRGTSQLILSKLQQNVLSMSYDSASDVEIDGISFKSSNKCQSALTDEELQAIDADSQNAKVWADCLKVCESLGKKEFVERVMQDFLCIICQEVVANPVTTPCRHNFCQGCFTQALKRGASVCPCCRTRLIRSVKLELNEELKAALRSILPGYDQGRH